MAQELTDLAGAAEHLFTTERHVRRLVAERRVPSYRVGGKVRLARADLDAYLAANRVEAS